jgi:hypothetical protein
MLALLIAAAMPAVAAAQGGSRSVVGVDAAGPSGAVAAGSTFQVTVSLQIKGGYHINAQKPSEDYLIGTSLKLAPPAGLTVGKVAYPAAKLVKFSFSETPLAVYEGTARIVATMKSDASLAPGQQTVPGKLTFQACNDQACLPPSTVDVSAVVEIGAPAEEKAALTLTGAPPQARVSVDGRAVGRADSRGRFVARDLDAGRRRVRVEMDGYEPWEQAVALDPGKPQTVAVSLVEAPAAPDGEPTAAPAAPPAGEAAAPPPAADVAPTGAAPAAQQSPGENWPLGLVLGLLGGAAVAALLLAVMRGRWRQAARDE